MNVQFKCEGKLGYMTVGIPATHIFSPLLKKGHAHHDRISPLFLAIGLAFTVA